MLHRWRFGKAARRAVALGALGLCGVALMVGTGSLGAATERGTIYSEVATFFAETSGHAVPLPAEVPPVDVALTSTAAEIRERFAPGKAELKKAARLQSLNALRKANLAALLELDSVIGAGIARTAEDTDWELVILVPEGHSLDAALLDLSPLALVEALQGFNYRLVQISAPVLTGDERPGLTNIWRTPNPVPSLGCIVSTMGWLALSNEADEVNFQGASTNRASVGYLTVLHGTATGPNHIWEDFNVTNREVTWSNSSNCSGTASGRSPRLGPNAPGNDLGDIRQDIDYVALEFRAACDHSEQYFAVGMPSCPDFTTKTSPFPLINLPISTSEEASFLGSRAQICGATTQSVREGILDGRYFTLQVPLVDHNGNPVLDGSAQVILTLDEMWMVTNAPADPDFAQLGDSGAPVWALDQTAVGTGGVAEWRPLGVQSATTTNMGTSEKLAFITPLAPDNLDDLDVEIIFDNPYNIDVEPCLGSCDNCDCSPRMGMTPEDGMNLLQIARAVSKGEVRRLTGLLVDHEVELRELENAEGADAQMDRFATVIAPLIRSSFASRESRRALSRDEVGVMLEMLSWSHHSLLSSQLKEELSRAYRFVAAYAEGRTVQEVVRLYFEGVKAAGVRGTQG